MIEPPQDWLTKPPALAAPGNQEMAKAVLEKRIHPAGSGAMVIRSLAWLYRDLGLQVALFDSSRAAQRVTGRILGQPNPDDVFTVDYCTGHKINGAPDAYVSLLNDMTAVTRWLEPYVMRMIAARLGVKNVVSQPNGAQLEGGDFTYLPHALPDDQSLLVTGSGINSRSNDAGRQWLIDTLKPNNHLDIQSPNFHRDLVSVLVQNNNGQLVLALLSPDHIQNGAAVMAALKAWNVQVVTVPGEAVSQCAVNLKVDPGLLVGMQTHDELTRVLHTDLPPGVAYHALPPDLQHLVQGFVDMQGGANCVSGNMLIDPEASDLSDAHIAEINKYAHSRGFEDELQAAAEAIDMPAAVAEETRTQTAYVFFGCGTTSTYGGPACPEALPTVSQPVCV